MTTTTKTNWAWLTATVFNTGYLKPGPGTYASSITVILWYLASRALQPALHSMPFGVGTLTALAALIITFIGIRASTIVARESARKDPQFIVIDEVAGQLVALILCPPYWYLALLCLILFRAFDILKPPPIRRIEHLPEGRGIMLDDIAAGFYALIAFCLIVLLYIEAFGHF